MVRGFYESIEMIREIPLKDGEAESNPVEWVMVTRSDPGGGIPRFMVERNVPSSIVQDAVKFLDWACAKDDEVEAEPTKGQDESAETPKAHEDGRRFSMAESNGITAGVGTSIADRPSHQRHMSQQPADKRDSSPESLVGDSTNRLHRTSSSSSSSSSSSDASFASAEQFTTAREGLPVDTSIPTPSASASTSQQSLPTMEDSHHARELAKLAEKKEKLKEKLDHAREKRLSGGHTDTTQKTQKEIDKATEKHNKERKKQEDKYQKEVRKLEQRREKETRKLLLRQQKEADKDQLRKAQRERDEIKQRANLLEQENKLLKEQIGDLQQENTALVARLGKTEEGNRILKDLKGGGRRRAGSSASSGVSGMKSKEVLSDAASLAPSKAPTTHF
jgi:hypothetical protein